MDGISIANLFTTLHHLLALFMFEPVWMFCLCVSVVWCFLLTCLSDFISLLSIHLHIYKLLPQTYLLEPVNTLLCIRILLYNLHSQLSLMVHVISSCIIYSRCMKRGNISLSLECFIINKECNIYIYGIYIY